ncbi:methylase of polypeptide subunit release factors [Tamaricihabitans halophyticus]|uniref:Methylase of polypeptide subunit release factors n=1 Tax=Tamaricihabitans halophyticus TaxID=1262583 RepID=A0A4R2QV01_9PSEU|nr:class I SAM-dependent methyltransferase [Tamaricihabitans halophyticus]TCP50925.1 methylase of polypeptide subunit release factors [Tamaricihabitans halophyticus]
MVDIHWTESGGSRSAVWHSATGQLPPRRIELADDRTRANDAYRLARAGTGLLWRGDYHNGRQLLQAVRRRIDRSDSSADATNSIAEAFRRQRQTRQRQAELLNKVLLELTADYRIPLRRAPDVRQACRWAYGTSSQATVLPLRELLGVLGAWQWHEKGVPIPALNSRIHPHYGVFSPTRNEYIDLVAEAPLPPGAHPPDLVFDIGTGTGVLAAVLANRGIGRIVATDSSPSAVACATANIARLGFAGQVDVVQGDMFPRGRAGLIVCNPPWLPGQPNSLLEQGVYDPQSQMLRGFLDQLRDHLEPHGQGWLILSDLAERLGLRTRTELLDMITAAGLRVLGRLDTAPRHPRSTETTDPVHAARAAEVVSLWRLSPADDRPG